MTVSSTTNRVTFAGNSVTTVFSYPYPVLSASDLVIYLTYTVDGSTVLQVLTTNYTFAGTAAANGTYPSGGNVTMLVAPPTNYTLVIYADPAATQSTHWVDGDPDPAAVKELAFDRLTILEQRSRSLLSRAVKLPDGFVGTFNPALPAVLTPNAVLQFDGTAANIINGPLATDVSAAQTNATAAAASASAAATSASAAATSATNAATSATNSATSATASAASATAAAASVTSITGVMTTSGDTLYGGVAGALTRLAGDTSNTRKFLREQSTAGVAQPPVWDTIVAGDIPTLNQNTTGTATNATNTAITDDTSTNATMYPTWVTANTGNLPQKVSSTKMSFNPSTGTLTTTTFSGALTGTASGNTTYTPNNHGVVLSGSGNTMTVLAPDASTTKVLTSGGSSADPTWATVASAPTTSYDLQNAGLSATVATNAMTIALKQSDGSTNPASGSGAVQIAFRNSTAATGSYSIVSATGALSIVIPSTATLGSSNANKNWVYVYAINNAGTIELAVSAMKLADSGSLVNTTILNTSSTSKTTLYSTTARTGVAVRLIGRVASTQATAGTWATTPSEVSLWPFENNEARSQIFYDTGNNYGSSNTRVRRFTNQRVNFGSDMTYADSATNGGSITINTDGLYSISYTDLSSGSDCSVGCVVNGTAGTTSLNNPLTYAQGYRGGSSTASAGTPVTHTVCLNLFAGDVVWFQTNTGNNTNTSQTAFNIIKIGL